MLFRLKYAQYKPILKASYTIYSVYKSHAISISPAMRVPTMELSSRDGFVTNDPQSRNLIQNQQSTTHHKLFSYVSYKEFLRRTADYISINKLLDGNKWIN